MKMLWGSLRFRDVSRWVKSLTTEAWWSKFNGENPPKPGHNGMHLQSQNFYSKMGGGEQSVTGRSWAEKQEIPSQQSGKWELAPESWSADFHVSHGMCVYACACLHMCVCAQVDVRHICRVLSFHHVDPGNKNQAVRWSNKHLDSMTYLSWSQEILGYFYDDFKYPHV